MSTITTITASNWNETVAEPAARDATFGVLLVLCSSWQFAQDFGMIRGAQSVYGDAVPANRLVGFVNCRDDPELCAEMGWYTNPTIRFGRPDALETYGNSAGEVNPRLVELIDIAVASGTEPENQNSAFAPAAWDVTTGPSLSELVQSTTAGVWIRYCASMIGECRRTQPAWQHLAQTYNSNNENTTIVAEVNCAAPELHKDHEISCSWSSNLPGVKYGTLGRQTRWVRPMEFYYHPADHFPPVLYTQAKLVDMALDLDAGTRIVPQAISSAQEIFGWDEKQRQQDDRRFMVLFTSSSCNIDDHQFDDDPVGYEIDGIDRLAYVCEFFFLEMLRVTRRFQRPIQDDNDETRIIIGMVDCDDDGMLCPQLGVKYLPAVLYGTPQKYEWTKSYYPYSAKPIRTANQGNFASLVDLADTFMGNDTHATTLWQEPAVYESSSSSHVLYNESTASPLSMQAPVVGKDESSTRWTGNPMLLAGVVVASIAVLLLVVGRIIKNRVTEKYAGYQHTAKDDESAERVQVSTGMS